MAAHLNVFLPVLLVFMAISSGPKLSESGRIFNIINNCKETVWPAVTPGESFNGGGFVLKPGQSVIFTAPVNWSGRIWGRTGCNFDNKYGNTSCQTGDCGGTLKCGASGKTPATLAEFTLAALDFYDVSLVDGFNLPMVVIPLNGTGNCSVSGCDGDLRPNCPSVLSVKANGKTVGCRSACVMCSTLMSIVAEGFLATLLHANPHIIPRCSKKHALQPIVMFMMIQPVSLLALARIMWLHSAQAGSNQCAYIITTSLSVDLMDQKVESQ